MSSKLNDDDTIEILSPVEGSIMSSTTDVTIAPSNSETNLNSTGANISKSFSFNLGYPTHN